MREEEQAILRRTRELVAAVPGVSEVGEAWSRHTGCLALPLTLLAPPGGDVPVRTRWFLVADRLSGAGTLDLHPAVDGGLRGTHPHQAWNGPSNPHPWTSGAICPRAFRQARKRLLPHDEPPAFPERAPWLVRAGLRWLEAAAEGTLTRTGEPFELPPLPSAQGPLIAFSEAPEDLDFWMERQGGHGLASFAEVRPGELLVATAFHDGVGAVQRSVRWGATILELRERARVMGAWVMLEHLPMLPPRHLPVTWGELLPLIEDQLRTRSLARVLAALHLPDGRESHPLLLGVPIPLRVGDRPAQIHWLAVNLSASARHNRPPDGFRTSAKSRAHFDRHVTLAAGQTVPWCPTRNWHPTQLSTRGACAALRGRRVLLIGGGALGSQVAELLVRAGLQRIDILDPDTLEAGNLVRHTGLFINVGSRKASDLANRLNLVSPHARATGHDEGLPPRSPGARMALLAADVIVDLSADDDVLQDLESLETRGSRVFVSGWIAARGARAYAFIARGDAFPVDAAQAAWQTQVEVDRAAAPPSEQPWEGAGCWSPVFPATAPEVAGGAAFIAERVVAALEGAPEGLHVYVAPELGGDGAGGLGEGPTTALGT